MVAIIGQPAGEPVEGYANTFIYVKQTRVTLGCYTEELSGNVSYSWNTNCSTCFPKNRYTKVVTSNGVTLCDTGTFTCTVSDGDFHYTSRPFTLYVSCKLQYLHIRIIYMYIYIYHESC